MEVKEVDVAELIHRIASGEATIEDARIVAILLGVEEVLEWLG